MGTLRTCFTFHLVKRYGLTLVTLIFLESNFSQAGSFESRNEWKRVSVHMRASEREGVGERGRRERGRETHLNLTRPPGPGVPPPLNSNTLNN